MTTRPWTRFAAPAMLLAALILSGCRDDPPETLLASARDYLARHDSRAAVIQAKNAIQKRPDLPEARFLLSQALLESGDAAGAELEARKALELKFPGDRGEPLLARTLLAQGKAAQVIEQFSGARSETDEGRAELQTVLGLAQAAQGNVVAAETALATALAVQPGFRPALVGQARVKAAARDYPGALSRLEAALAQDPGNPEAIMLKGDILAIQGQGAEALESYRRAQAARPDFAPAHRAVISVLLDQGKTEEAAVHMAALRELAPKDPETRYLDALVALRRGDDKAAHDLVQPLVQIAPDNARVLQLAGAVEYQRHAWQPAEAHLSKALAVAPELALARRLLVSLYLQSGQPGKALAALEPVHGKLEGDAQMLALAGQVYVRNGDFQKAEQAFAKAAALDPQDAGKRTSLALAHLAKGQVDAALGELERIAAADGGAVADLALIASFLERRRFDEALQAIAALEKKQPGTPRVHDLRGRALAGKGDGAGARRSFEQAVAADPAYLPAVAALARLDLAAGRPADANRRFEKAVDAAPNDRQALLAWAELRRRTEAKPEAVAALLKRAVAADTADPVPWLALVDHYLRSQDTAHAVAAAQEAASALPERPEILDALGIAQLAGKDFNQALSTYGRLASLEPKSPQPYLRMADVHLAAGHGPDAAGSLRKALELAPVAAVAIRLHTVLLQQEGEGAEGFAGTWLREHPKDAGFLRYLGDRALARQDYDGAVRHYRAALEIQPDNVAVLNNLAWVAGRQKSAQAIDYAEKARRLAPDQPAVLDTLAMLVLEKGDAKRAVELLQRAVQLAPGQAQIRLNLAKALIQAGNKAAARKELEELGKLGDKFPGHAEIAQLLRQV